jgi:hypothetical protein
MFSGIHMVCFDWSVFRQANCFFCLQLERENCRYIPKKELCGIVRGEKGNQRSIGIMMSLNNVHEPRNAEFTAFLGSFLVE